jgi:RHS repeat-associated protein
MTDASGTTTYSYDAMDRLTQKATPEGTLTYTYDAASNLASISSNHANGVSASYAYENLNRLSTVVDNRLNGSNTTTYAYDTADNIATATYPNNIETTLTYDALNRISSLSSPVSSYTYQHGPTGNLASATEQSGRSTSWTYDEINRLTNETISLDPANHNGSVSYGLDPVGNRTSAASTIAGLAPMSGTFNADDQLSTETYDANGNVLSTGGKTYSYDSENRLASMNNGTVQLLYDGDGNRVAKNVNGVVTYYLVDDLNPTGYSQIVEELSGTGSVQRQFTYGLQRISENQIISNTWTPSFYGYDEGANVRALTNSTGEITDTFTYDAFGNKVATSGSTPNSYLYRGEQFDSDLGLYYLRARYYNPLTGRFLSRDPEDGDIDEPASLHNYLYAEGDPVDLSDPTGKSASAVATRTPVASEYALIAVDISLGAVAGLKGVAQEVSCILYNSASKLNAWLIEYAGEPDGPSYVPPYCAVGASWSPFGFTGPEPGRGPGPPPLPPPPPPPPCDCPAGWHTHHLLPQNQTMKTWFGARPRFLDVDDPRFLMCLPPELHTRKQRGIHTKQGGVSGTDWNSYWARFIRDFPNASTEDVINYLDELINQFGLQTYCRKGDS